jgi:HEAT repeat protein
MMLSIALALSLSTGADEAAALDAFKAEIKGKDAAGRAAALGELAKTSGPKVAAKLQSYLVTDTTEVRIAAATGLGLQAEALKPALAYLSQGAAINAKNPPVLAAIVAAFGKLKDEAGAVEVNKHYGDELEVAKAAVQAAGEIRSPSSFDGLIKELKACDEALKPRDRQQGGFGGGFGRMDGQNNPREARERARELQPLLKGVLQAMAGITCEDGKDWEAWWRENRAKFKTGSAK